MEKSQKFSRTTSYSRMLFFDLVTRKLFGSLHCFGQQRFAKNSTCSGLRPFVDQMRLKSNGIERFSHINKAHYLHLHPTVNILNNPCLLFLIHQWKVAWVWEIWHHQSRWGESSTQVSLWSCSLGSKFTFKPWPGSLWCVLGKYTLLSQCISPPRTGV